MTGGLGYCERRMCTCRFEKDGYYTLIPEIGDDGAWDASRCQAASQNGESWVGESA